MVAVLSSKTTRTLDYYLVFLQSIFDFFSSGLFGSFYGFVMSANYLHNFCSAGYRVDYLYYYRLEYYYNIRKQPE